MILEKIESAKGRNRPAVYLVKDGSTIVGMLEKYNDKRGLMYPWMAYYGWGVDRQFIGSFDASNTPLPPMPKAFHGSKDAALQAIADRRLATGGKIPAGTDYEVP